MLYIIGLEIRSDQINRVPFFGGPSFRPLFLWVPLPFFFYGFPALGPKKKGRKRPKKGRLSFLEKT